MDPELPAGCQTSGGELISTTAPHAPPLPGLEDRTDSQRAKISQEAWRQGLVSWRPCTLSGGLSDIKPAEPVPPSRPLHLLSPPPGLLDPDLGPAGSCLLFGPHLKGRLFREWPDHAIWPWIDVVRFPLSGLVFVKHFSIAEVFLVCCLVISFPPIDHKLHTNTTLVFICSPLSPGPQWIFTEWINTQSKSGGTNSSTGHHLMSEAGQWKKKITLFSRVWFALLTAPLF